MEAGEQSDRKQWNSGASAHMEQFNLLLDLASMVAAPGDGRYGTPATDLISMQTLGEMKGMSVDRIYDTERQGHPPYGSAATVSVVVESEKNKTETVFFSQPLAMCLYAPWSGYPVAIQVTLQGLLRYYPKHRYSNST